MFRKLFIFVAVVLFLPSAANAIWPFVGSEKKEEIKVETDTKKKNDLRKEQEILKKLEERGKAVREIKEIERNEGYYSARGIAELGEFKEYKDKLWMAINAARQRAREELAKRIKVKIVITVVDILKSDEKKVEEDFVSKTESYCEELLMGVEIREYRDYSREGEVTEVTAIAFILESKYQETVINDLKNKKVAVLTPVKEGIKALNQKNFGFALTRFIEATSRFRSFFDGVPVNEDVDDDGKIEEISGFLSARVGEIVSRTELKTVDQRIIVDKEGRVAKNPTVFVFYVDEKGKVPISGIPLKTIFGKGSSGNISEISLTGMQGETEIRIESVDVDPSSKEAVLDVTIDRESLGLEKYLLLPSCRIIIPKMKYAAYCVNFYYSGTRIRPSLVIESLKSVLVNYGFTPLEFDIKNPEPEDQDMKAVTKLNVNYLIHVYISANSRKDEYDMYKADATSKATIYSFPTGEQKNIIEGPSSNGYDRTASRAGLEALTNLTRALMNKLTEKIKELK